MNTKIILKADTSSEWDICDLAIVDLECIDKEKLSERIALVKQSVKDSDFSNIRYAFWGTKFLVDTQVDVGEWLSEKYLSEDENWNFLPDLNMEFDAPHNKLGGFEIVFTTEGAYFTAMGKHTGERFWTESIPMSILEQYTTDRKSEPA